MCASGARCPSPSSRVAGVGVVTALEGLCSGLQWPYRSIVTLAWPVCRLLRRGAEEWQEKGFVCSSWVKRISLHCGLDGKHYVRLVQIFPEVCQQPQKWSLIENSWEEAGAQPLLAFPCPGSGPLCGCSSGPGLCQGPRRPRLGTRLGTAAALPGCRLQLKGWNQLNQKGLGRACRSVFLSGLAVKHGLQSLQDELTVARFSGQRQGLSAGRVAHGLCCPLKSPQPSCGAPAREWGHRSKHPCASLSPGARAFPGACCLLCCSRSPFHLIPVGHHPRPFQPNFLQVGHAILSVFLSVGASSHSKSLS